LTSPEGVFTKLPGVKAYTVFSEELGIKTFPEGASESEANVVVFIDPIDGTEFIEQVNITVVENSAIACLKWYLSGLSVSWLSLDWSCLKA